MKAAIREQEFDVVTLRGTVSVGYFREDGQWFAVAREFDLLGSGDTREDALRELKEVVEDYVEACVFEGAAKFEKPSPDEEWDRTTDRQSFVLLLSQRRTVLGTLTRPNLLAE